MRETLLVLGTVVTVACLVSAVAWLAVYAFTSRWWTNPYGRLMVLTSSWQTIGLAVVVRTSLWGESPLMLVVGDSTAGAAWRLAFDVLVFTSLIYQWVLLVRTRRECGR